MRVGHPLVNDGMGVIKILPERHVEVVYVVHTIFVKAERIVKIDKVVASIMVRVVQAVILVVELS